MGGNLKIAKFTRRPFRSCSISPLIATACGRFTHQCGFRTLPTAGRERALWGGAGCEGLAVHRALERQISGQAVAGIERARAASALAFDSSAADCDPSWHGRRNRLPHLVERLVSRESVTNRLIFQYRYWFAGRSGCHPDEDETPSCAEA